MWISTCYMDSSSFTWEDPHENYFHPNSLHSDLALKFHFYMLYIDFPWVFHGFFMGFLIFHGFPWFFMAFHGLAMDLPWICHGFSTGFPHRRSGHPPGFVHPQRPPAPLVSAAMRRAADRPQQRSETNGHLIGDKFWMLIMINVYQMV